MVVSLLIVCLALVADQATGRVRRLRNILSFVHHQHILRLDLHMLRRVKRWRLMLQIAVHVSFTSVHNLRACIGYTRMDVVVVPPLRIVIIKVLIHLIPHLIAKRLRHIVSRGWILE